MKKLLLIILILFIGCKTTKVVKNNKIDVTSLKTDKSAKVVRIDTSAFDLSEITVVSADPDKETTITDSKGNTKTFRNIKSVTIKKQSEVKESKKIDEKKDIKETLIDKSIIKEKHESISDTVQYKWIFIAIAFVVGFALIGYLVFKFKK